MHPPVVSTGEAGVQCALQGAKIQPAGDPWPGSSVKIDYVWGVNGAAAQAVLDASSPLQRNDRLQRRLPPARAIHKEHPS